MTKPTIVLIATLVVFALPVVVMVYLSTFGQTYSAEQWMAAGGLLIVSWIAILVFGVWRELW